MRKTNTAEKKTKSLSNTGSKSRAQRSGSKDHKRTYSTRYKEDAKNEEERLLTSPVQEIVPQPIPSCQISREFDQFIETGNNLANPTKVHESSSSSLYAWGSNQFGQICTASKFVNDPALLQLPNIGHITQVACGRAHTAVVTEDGAVFVMGDNSKGQLGTSSTQSGGPYRIEGIQRASFVVCGANSTFAVANGQIWAWGEIYQGEDCWKPTSFALPYGQQVKQISAGKTHFAAITTTDQLYVWGSNEHGQLGLKDKVVRKTPTTSANFNGLQVTKVSCGDDFTFVITRCNEILVTGKLPFAIEQADGTTANCVTSFQPIAQFENGVEVLQIETTKFASILVKPGDPKEPRELFMWGQTPLGLFQEPTSLNQLVQECQEGQQSQTFDIKVVKNGQNFSIFVDDLTGMTYSLGTEDLKDPYESQGQVSLSELRDVKFSDAKLFACGSDFVIGQSTAHTRKLVLPESPESAKKAIPEMLCTILPHITEENQVDEVLSEISSASKVIKLKQIEINQQQIRSITKSDCVNMNTLSNLKFAQTGEELLSEHSFRQDALFKDDLTETSCADLPEMKFQAAQEAEILEEQVRNPESPKSTSDQKKDMTFNHTRELQYKNAKPPLPKREESEGEGRLYTARDHSAGHLGFTPRDRNTGRDSNVSAVYKTAHNDKNDFKKFGTNLSDVKPAEIRKLDYSPNISPITRHSIVRDSIADLANEMNAINLHHGMEEHSSFQPFECYNHNHQPSEIVHTSSLCQPQQVQTMPHAYGCRQIASDEPYLSSHGPQFQNRYSHYQRNIIHHQSPAEAFHSGRAPLSSRMMPQQSTNSASQLPFTQATNVINGSNSKQLVSNRVSNVAMAQTNLNTVFQSMDGGPCDTRVVNMSNLHASYCGPFVNPVLDQSIYQLELESMLVKDKADVLEQSLRDERAKRTNIELSHKAEMEQARAQYQELMRQMEKAAKDYAKLMYQIDADQEETAQLREKVRSQECRIESLQLQEFESADKLTQFQTENSRLQTELKEAQLKILKMVEESAKMQNASTKTCQSGLCEQRVSELEETIQKKSLVINDMARKLGGIELQNKELVQELKDRSEAHQQRLTDLKAMYKQENQQEQEKNEQLQSQVNELKFQLEEMRKKGAESCRSTKDIGISTFDQQQLIKFFDASPAEVQQVQEPMVIRSSVVMAARTTRNLDDKVDFSGNQRVVYAMSQDQDAPSVIQSSRNVSPGVSVQKSPIQDRDNSADSSKSGQRRRRLRNERMSSQKDILSDFARSTKNLHDGFKLPTARDDLVQFAQEFSVDQRQSIDPQHKPSQNLGQMSERSASRLRQPTLISKSPGLTATLEMIEQRSSCLHLKTNEPIEVSANPLNKISSMAGLTSRQPRPLQTNSQSILQVAPQDFAKRHQTPNSSTMLSHRPSLTTMSVKSTTNQNREVTPRRSYAQPLPSARGPPQNLVNRLENKTGKFTPGADVKRLSQSASSTNVQIKRTYDSKRNNLMAKYATNFERNIGKDQLNQARTGSRDDSEQLIDIMLNSHIPGTATDRNIKLSELDASEHSIQFVGTRHSPNVRQSFEVSNIQHTPSSRNNVLQDNTNGLSTMKEKLKSIQDNKQMLEKKIQEYEQKLQKMHSKRNSRKSIITDENVSSLYVSQAGNCSRNADSSDISAKLTARKTPTPSQTAGFRNCMVNNVPNQPKLQSQLHSQPSTRSMFNNKY